MKKASVWVMLSITAIVISVPIFFCLMRWFVNSVYERDEMFFYCYDYPAFCGKDNGKFPESWDELWSYMKTTPIFKDVEADYLHYLQGNMKINFEVLKRLNENPNQRFLESECWIVRDVEKNSRKTSAYEKELFGRYSDLAKSMATQRSNAAVWVQDKSLDSGDEITPLKIFRHYGFAPDCACPRVCLSNT